MPKGLSWILSFTLTTITYAVPSVCRTADSSLSGVVQSVTDGDTIKLVTASGKIHIIRLMGIDAPEMLQSYGPAAKKALSDLTLNRQATAHCPKSDKYGRHICVVHVGTVDIGLALIRMGMAWHYKRYVTEQLKSDREIYAAEELEARKRGSGIWASPGAVAPWEFRRQRP